MFDVCELVHEKDALCWTDVPNEDFVLVRKVLDIARTSMEQVVTEERTIDFSLNPSLTDEQRAELCKLSIDVAAEIVWRVHEINKRYR